MSTTVTREQADKMMATIGYVRGMEFSPNSPEHEIWYSNKNPEEFSIAIMIRLKDGFYMFRYIPSNSTTTRLTTCWLAPITNKKTFMERFNSFVSDAKCLRQKYDQDTCSG